MKFNEILFRLNVGVDTYEPDITDGANLKFKRLKNIHPSRNRLETPKGRTVLQSITGATTPVRSFAYYANPTSQFVSLYALTNTSAYRFDFSSQLFDTTPIYTGFLDNEEIYAKTPWLDAVYVTKREDAKLVKFVGSTASVISGAPGARYMIIADSHLMLANTRESGVDHPVRVQWSDLYAPESFTVDPASEADFFELSPDDSECTGLSYQRNSVIVYTRNKIWVGRYIQASGDSLGTFRFEVLFAGIGNVYHNAQISVREVDYFLGADGIYKLDGFQLTDVGNPIWQFFEDTVADSNYQDSVIAIHDPKNSEVRWIYNHVDGGRWSIVYNYQEDKWSDGDPDDVYCNLTLDFPAVGYIPYEDVNTAYSAMGTNTYDGDWQFLDSSIKQLFGGSAGGVYVPGLTYVKIDNTAFSCEMETYEFDFEQLDDVKEVDRIRTLFSLRDTAEFADCDLALYIGSRKHRAAAVTWSTAVNLADMFDNDVGFYFRSLGVGKLIRFKFVWTNKTACAISEFTKLSLYKLVQDGNPDKEK